MGELADEIAARDRVNRLFAWKDRMKNIEAARKWVKVEEGKTAVGGRLAVTRRTLRESWRNWLWNGASGGSL